MRIAATWNSVVEGPGDLRHETQLVPAAFRDLTVRKPAPRWSGPGTLLLVILVLLMASAADYGWYY
jgi:hypothetical protein